MCLDGRPTAVRDEAAGHRRCHGGADRATTPPRRNDPRRRYEHHPERGLRGHLDERATECVIAAAGGKATPWTNPDGLTDREVEVLKLISGGLTNREVAEELYISPKTVGRHVENIYTKIGVFTSAGAAAYAIENRLLG